MAKNLNLEHTYCSSKTCPKKDQCGNHIARIKGEHWICWQGDLYEEDKEKCGYEEPYDDIVVPEWLQNLSKEIKTEREKKENQNGRS